MRSGVLQEVLARVIARHPFRGSGEVPVLPAGVDVGALWARVLSVPATEQGAAIESLTRRERRLLRFGVIPHLQDARTPSIVARLAPANPEGWRETAAVLFLTNNGCRELVTLAKDVAGRLTSGLVRAALSSTSPLDTLTRSYLEGRDPLTNCFLQVKGELWEWAERRVRRHVLMVAACKVLITREGITTIQRWRSQLLADSERVEWSLRYVRETYKSGWQDNDEVLLELIERFQAPSEVSPFWLRLEAEPREAVRQWVLGRELNELLGDSRRVAFWRRYLPWMRLVNSNSDDEAVFVHFDDWSAVVFIQPGRATYLLSRDRIRGLSRHDSTQLYLRILHLKNTGYAIGRYEQRGGYWEYTAALEVGRVMRMME